ncbi:unnamed protein product [Didymodactylos carnosus]|uniref:Uncharacterized protein n=1 Tax=Didymodactylos carnosus TaxID=1234261 RepID=A0A8S2FEY0_9BILA|nr:unnamed protein product [Didymodactylos carnosus]CAF4243847.1 unnamed protein product [Didymodactylos carnosus]
MFTNDLTWTTDINKVYFKTSSIVELMKYYKHVLSRNALEIIYKSCVLSILNYGCIIYSLTTVANLNNLESVQYKAAIATVGAMKRTSREKVYEILGWFSLKAHFRILRLLTFSKIMKGFTPGYLSVHLHIRQPNERYNLRSNQNTNVETMRNTSKDFFVVVTEEWNGLVLKDPRDLRMKVANTREMLKNEVTPTEKFSKRLKFAIRREEIIFMRIKSNFPALNYYVYKRKCVDPPLCSCEGVKKDTVHYFFNCSLYNVERNLLKQKLNFLNEITLDIFLLDDLQLQCIVLMRSACI